MSVNKVILVGNLGADPELKHTNGGKAVANLSIATNESFKNAAGERQDRTEWHRVTVWGEQAEVCAKYLEKGRMVYVEGKLQTRSYEKGGEKRYATEIIADKVTFLGGSGGGGQRREAPAAGGRRSWGNDMGGNGGGASPDSGGGDDIPF